MNEFSLVSGGPLYQIYLRTHLARPVLELLPRRIAIFALVTWFPPFLLSFWQGTAFSGVPVPFLYDVATHTRFLIALPLLLLAECVVHRLLFPVIEQSVDRQVVKPEAVPKFKSLIEWIMRWRNSTWVEFGLLILVLAVTYFVSARTALKTASWYFNVVDSDWHLTAAGFWYAWVSMPIFQFILLRWIYRWSLWVIFLRRMSTLPLQIIPTHPDRAGGLSYFSHATVAFLPIVAAMSSIISGVIAGKILYEGIAISSFKFEIVTAVLVLTAFALGPLCLFIPRLAVAKREGELQYGYLSSRYVNEFDAKWNRKDAAGEQWLGTSDIQSLADIGNSYSVVDRMRLVPFDRDAVVQVAVAALLPLLPLVFFVIPFDQLFVKVVKIIF